MRVVHLLIYWAIAGVLYLAGVALYALGAHTPVAALPELLLRPKVLVAAALISLLIAIPPFQFTLGARSRAYRKEQVRPNSDPFVLPSDAEDTRKKERRLRQLARENDLSIKLWMLFVVLMSFIGLYLLFHYTHGVARVGVAPSESATSTPETLPQLTAASTTPPLPAPDVPKFGGREKTPEETAADEAYRERMLTTYGGLEEALEAELAVGWSAFFDRASSSAMRSFNRAWLLSATSTDALYGMSLVEGVRGNFDSSIALVEEALALGAGRSYMRCDLALSYYNKAMRGAGDPALLTRAQEEIDTVEAAEGMTPGCYRTAARVARARGEEERAAGYDARASSSVEAAPPAGE